MRKIYGQWETMRCDIEHGGREGGCRRREGIGGGRRRRREGIGGGRCRRRERKEKTCKKSDM